MRSPHLVSSLLLAVACSVTEPSRDPLVELDGHYVGEWAVWIRDTIPEGGGWSPCMPCEIVTRVNCPVAIDLTMTGDTTLAGTFVTDTTGGCHVGGDTGFSLPIAGSLLDGVVAVQGDDGRGHVAGHGTLRFGSDFRRDFEELFGCRLVESVANLRVGFTGGDAAMFGPAEAAAGSSILYISLSMERDGLFPADPFAICTDQPVELIIRITAIRP